MNHGAAVRKVEETSHKAQVCLFQIDLKFVETLEQEGLIGKFKSIMPVDVDYLVGQILEAGQ